MGECGCGMDLTTYRLPAPDGKFYAVELYPGCVECSTGPAVYIRHVNKSVWDWEEVRKAPMLPTFGLDGEKQSGVRCGLPRDEFREAARVSNAAIGSMKDNDTDELADELWEEAVRGRLEVIEPARA